MPRLPQLIGADDLDDEQKWVLLDVLFAPSGALTASIAILGACLTAWVRHQSAWAAVWALSAIIVAIFRMGLSAVYRRRAKSGDPGLWGDVFYVASCLTGLQWGLGGLGILTETDGTVLATILGVLCALMAGAGARGHTHPGAAMAQVATAAFGIGSCSALAGQWMLAIIMVVYMVYQASFVKSFARMSLTQILSSEDRKKLVQNLEYANERLARANAQLEDLSLTDALTNVGNRRCFDRDLDVAWRGATMGSAHVALGLIDVDHFKSFNDKHGHLAGDACLALVAAAISQGVQGSGACVYRYGGEEFAFIFQNTDMDTVRRFAGRVADAVRAVDLDTVAGPGVKVTVSIGLAELAPGDQTAIWMLIAQADQALYGAKRSGRDCVQGPAASPADVLPAQQRLDLRVA